MNGESQYTNRSQREDIAMMSDDEAVQGQAKKKCKQYNSIGIGK